MASKTVLNARNLEALGAARLADLLIGISTGDAVARRRLRLALAGAESPKEAARAIGKRLTGIAGARTFVDWHKLKPLAKDLETQRCAIRDQVAPHDPAEALALLWRFVGLATPLFERCDDSNGVVIDIFRQACADLGDVAGAAGPEPEDLAQQIADRLLDNGFGQYDGLIATLAPVLGPKGIAHLKGLVEDLGRQPVEVPPEAEWRAVGWGSGDTLYAHELEDRKRQDAVRMALKQIADVQGDVDAFIAQFAPEVRKAPGIAADIAMRLLAAGRAGEALGFLDRAEVSHFPWIPREWQDARIEALDALGRTDEAQAFLWACFERDLSPDRLRAYLKRLPDFEDDAAEERALALAATGADPLRSLDFFLRWPALDHAARLLLDRHDRIDGDAYEVLGPAAEHLSAPHPLAATIALRAMIDFSLRKARSTRYGHAARHLATCAELAGSIRDFAPFEPHGRYLARLKAQHGKKAGFWSLVER